ncbi:putative acetyltransferase [Cocos nucifera]|uniref:Putative acetyltransferase n=1 Tax=Cocos nucifera TaxID=13894 RepID=A0A8K0I8R6_COCNU|nr:putative acetyltransferase [Cocos nucifera]
MAAPATTEVQILSRRMVRPSSPSSQSRGVITLTPWDLKLLSVDYIQKGILFLKPPAAAYNANEQREEDGGKEEEENSSSVIISGLLSSFARALDYFFPLAGRLITAKHEDTNSLSIFLDCNDEGAEFIHASADKVTVSDVLAPLYIPPVVPSFFPLNGVVGCDGHSMPLLAVQVTELADGGIFVGCSLSHAVADGTSFWHFFNSWSHLSRDHHQVSIPNPPTIDRWFLDSCPPPIRLPFADQQDFIRRMPYPPVKECAFHFSARTIANIKSRANTEMGTDRISSLQALLGLLWCSVTRARRLDPAQETTYFVLVGCRSRLSPSLPATYLGNAITIVEAKSTAGELSEHGPGWAAFLLNQAVASSSEATLRDGLEMWTKEPSFSYMDQFKPCDLTTGSSPRFNIYGNDFGWGRPVAVRSGPGSKVDGKATIYPGADPGSMALEVSLSSQALSSLIQDQEFMQEVSNDEA